MNYTIYTVGLFALVLCYRRYCRRPSSSRRLQYHERFQPIRVLEPGTDPVKDSFGLHLWKRYHPPADPTQLDTSLPSSLNYRRC